MANVDGQWDCVTKTPMGEQKSVFTVVSNGDSFTGSNAGPMGTLDVIDGKVDGDTLSWKMELKVPMAMVMDATATVDGDTLKGEVKLGAFGVAPMSGTRKA
ncbi:hypothetical protein SAMN06295912_12427 [Sphingomonas laterariae]|uniref:Uncharacterized protein n=1 Tax=Edaphosphingomonas laterariae TaxID=861865 RepID=A0A239IFN0_9SPHN|nr:hypothetical protein [Sphingomonas laterariae]SNS92460.1 hypothetical protein SAMN06295912_12427 [Sphingomonas laterariae]